MSYWGGAWNSLKFSPGSSSDSMMSSISYRYLHGTGGNLIYKNNRAYKSVLVHVAKQMAMQAIEGTANRLFPKYQRYLERQLLNDMRNEQNKNQKALIDHFSAAKNSYGELKLEGGETMVAADKYGNKVEDALIISYESEEKGYAEILTVTNTLTVGEPPGAFSLAKNRSVDDFNMGITNKTYNTKTVFMVDLNPQISMQSSKNIVLTKVQGRDFTRKELVSGGDLSFSVSGEINSNFDGVYPEREVQRFINIMQYSGIVNVNHRAFGQCNVKKVIIQSYQLGAPTFKNAQPYSFTCVAVEPDEDVTVAKDTIAALNKELALSPMDAWYKFILNNKLAEVASNVVSGGVSSLANAGLDALTPNI